MDRVFHVEIKNERLEDESGKWKKTQSFVMLNKRSRRDDRTSRIPDPEQQ